MYIYKAFDIFDRDTGKKVGSEKRISKTLCDYTGNELEDEEISYEVNYNSIDPCTGCTDEETALWKAYPQLRGCIDEFLLDPFVVGHPNEDREEFVSSLNKEIKKYLNEGDDYFLLDHAFRTIKVNTIRRLLDSGLYVIEQFLPR